MFDCSWFWLILLIPEFVWCHVIKYVDPFTLFMTYGFWWKQEKELTERHAKWLDEELTAKVDSYAELRRRHSDLESEMSAKLVDVRPISYFYSNICLSVFFSPYSFFYQVEKNYIECSSSLNWHKERLRELETKIGSLQEVCMACNTYLLISYRVMLYDSEIYLYSSYPKDLSSCKDAATTTEEQYTAELFTVSFSNRNGFTSF